jgi:glycosyltransferase involved in cell wall biosynthesis
MSGVRRSRPKVSLRVLLHSWRDLDHPEAGGAERYLVTVAEGLAARGHDVLFRTAAYPGATSGERVNGVSYERRGGRLGVYPAALAARTHRRFVPDVIVDVQNGVPFLSPLMGRTPVVNLVHHVHREQWPVVFGPRLSRAGWWLESQVAPAVYRRCQYVAVSDSTRRDLVQLGVAEERITVIHNGTEALLLDDVPRSPTPSIVVLGRLVPQKRVEYALQAVAALIEDIPDITLDIVGSGWWLPQLQAMTTALGIDDRVSFHGHVSETEKHRLLANAWVHAMPSLKEGWGLVVVEAGVHGTPTVAFRDAGGPNDSIVDGRTGVLVDGRVSEFAAALRMMIRDSDGRAAMSREVSQWVRRFSWVETVDRWERLLTELAHST